MVMSQSQFGWINSAARPRLRRAGFPETCAQYSATAAMPQQHRWGEAEAEGGYFHRVGEDVVNFLHPVVLPIRQKKYFPTPGVGLGRQEDGADQILDRTQAEVLNAAGNRGLDPVGEALKKSQKGFIPGPIDRGGPEDQERQFVGLGQGQFLPPPFAHPVGRDRPAMVGFCFLPTVLPRSCGCLAGKIDKFLESGVMFEAGLDEIFRAQGIHRAIGFCFDGPGGAGEMQDQVDILDTRP